jgi:hypothetical protein
MTTNDGDMSDSPLMDLLCGGLEEPQPSMTSLIQQKLQDRKTPLAELLRLVQLEQTSILIEQRWAENDPQLRSYLSDRWKASTMLHKFLLESWPRPKGDMLNLDGPKFHHFEERFFDTFEQAALQAGLPRETAAQAKKAFQEAFKKKLPQIRQELDMMDESGEEQ